MPVSMAIAMMSSTGRRQSLAVRQPKAKPSQGKAMPVKKTRLHGQKRIDFEFQGHFECQLTGVLLTKKIGENSGTFGLNLHQFMQKK
jgi:hypothetical protein